MNGTNCAAVWMVLSLAFSAAAGARDALPRVPIAEAAPVVDGDLSDPAWKAGLTLKLDGFCDGVRRKKGERPADATEAVLLTDKENLYIAFRCNESHSDGPWIYANARHKRRMNSHVMGGDYVAVAIDMGRFGFYNYTMFFVNAVGDVYKCFTWPHRYDLVLRDLALPAATAAAKVDKAKRAWTVELKIPLKDLLRYPADGFPKTVGLDLRRVQWGADRGKHKLDIYWTGMANVTGNRVQPQYDHMATWRPLFETFPDYKNAYAAGRGWVQLVFPESFGHVTLDAGTLDNKLVVGEGKRLVGLIGTRTGWHNPKKYRALVAKQFDAPRMEHWADVRRLPHPTGEPKVIVTEPVNKPGAAAPRFVKKPTVTAAEGRTQISFTVSAATDVTVAVLDAKGRIIRHLAAGVLGANPPKPLVKDTLAQTVAWDRTDDFGRPAPAGAYTVRVRLGLAPRFQYAIELDKKNWWYQDPTPTAKGLDIDNMPKPTIGKSLGHFSRGSLNYLTVDRETEELYVQTQHVHDGRTGKKLRDVKLDGPQISNVYKAARTGELACDRRNGWIYMSGPNDVWRFDRAGKPMPFEAIGRHFVTELWGGHSNPHRGVCADLAGNVYKMHHYIPHTAFHNQVTRIGADGRIKDYGFIEIRTLAAGVRVDREGNVYVGCTIQPPEALPPKDLAARMLKRPRTLFKRIYGSIVKFPPSGGIIRPDPEGKLVCPSPRGTTPFVAQGATWVHPGYSPMLSRVSDSAGGPGCSCRNARFDLDDFGRLFVPDAVYGRIEIIDGNANTICFVGRRGKADPASGAEFGWPTQAAASDEALYVADYLRYRVSRLKFEYAAEAAASVQVK